MLGGGERSIIQGALRHAGVINDRLGYKIVGYYSQGEDWKLDPNDPHDRELLEPFTRAGGAVITIPGRGTSMARCSTGWGRRPR